MKTIITACLSLLLISGCATNTSTDPTDDSLLTSIRCTLTTSCQNHNDAQAAELENEQRSNEELRKQQSGNEMALKKSESELAALRSEVSDLDKTIARLQAEASAARAKNAEINPVLDDALAQLDDLRNESQLLESGVLMESVDVAEIQAKKEGLEQWRDQLEQVLSAAM